MWNNQVHKVDIKANYVSLNIINRFYKNNFFVDFGPGFDVLTTKSSYIHADVDLTFNVGLGYKLTDNILLQSRFKIGIVDATTLNYELTTSNKFFSFGMQYKL